MSIKPVTSTRQTTETALPDDAINLFSNALITAAPADVSDAEARRDEQQFYAQSRRLQVEANFAQQDLQTEAARLIATHTNYRGLNLNEDGLGRDLAARVGERPNLARAVYEQLSESNKVEVARAMVGAMSDEQLREMFWDDEGRAMLLDINRWVANNELTGDGRANAAADRQLRERIGVALTRRDDVREITTQQPQTIQPTRRDSAAPEEITAEQLLRIEPSLGDRATQIATDLNQAMRDAEITTRVGQAMFIAQVLHEIGTRSDLHEDGGRVRYRRQVYDYFFYMYDKDSPNPARRRVALEGLGNTEPGDGAKFHGRGYIQLSGRRNYERAGRQLGLDLANNPDLAAEPSNAVRIAGWFWRHGNGNLNDFANNDTTANFRTVTRRINGGLNGYQSRLTLYQRAKSVLGAG